MKGLLLLAGIRLRMLVNSYRRPSRDTIFRSAFFITLGAVFIAGDYSFFFRIITYLKGEELIGPILITQLMDMMALTLFFMLFFSTIVAAISTLYLSSDLNMMLSLPLDITGIFIIKFVQTIINSSCMVVIFAVPMLCALGGVYESGAQYYLNMLLFLIPFILIPAMTGILFTVSLIKYFPAKRMQQVMTFFIVLFLSGLVVFIRFLKPETLYGNREMGDNMIMDFFDKMSIPKSPWLPSSWLTEGIMGLVDIKAEVTGMPLELLYITGASVFFITLLAAKGFYLAGLSEAGTSAQRKNQKRDIIDSLLFSLPLPVRARALLSKDIKLFLRDTGQWSQMFILGTLVIVYLFNIKNLPLHSHSLKNLVAFLNLGLAGFVLASVAIRFVFPSVSLEGGAIWIIKSSPLEIKSFLWQKFITFLIPLLLLGEILIVFSNILLKVDSFIMVLSAATIFLMTLGITGLGVGLGAMYPRFRYENVAQVAAGTGGIIYMILCLAYIALVIIIEARPVYMHFKSQIFIGRYTMTGLYLAAAAITTLTAIAVFIPLKKGQAALERIDV